MGNTIMSPLSSTKETLKKYVIPAISNEKVYSTSILWKNTITGKYCLRHA
jgi:hypothetical protein